MLSEEVVPACTRFDGQDEKGGGGGEKGDGEGGWGGLHTRSMVLLLGVIGVPGGSPGLEDCILGDCFWRLQPALPPLWVLLGCCEAFASTQWGDQPTQALQLLPSTPKAKPT